MRKDFCLDILKGDRSDFDLRWRCSVCEDSHVPYGREIICSWQTDYAGQGEEARQHIVALEELVHRFGCRTEPREFELR